MPEGRWAGVREGRWAGVPEGRSAGGPVGRWAGHIVSLQHSVTSATATKNLSILNDIWSC